MLRVEFSPVQQERFGLMVADVLELGYGFSCGWQNPDQLLPVKEELLSFAYTNEHIPYEDVLYLPELSSGIFAGLGSLSLRSGLVPKQAMIIEQLPGETGRTHFDKNVRVSIILPLHQSRVHMLQPGRFGVPLIDENTGEFTLEDAHKVMAPVGTLLGFAGTKLSAIASSHRVDNPSRTHQRYSLALGCQ